MSIAKRAGKNGESLHLAALTFHLELFCGRESAIGTQSVGLANGDVYMFLKQ